MTTTTKNTETEKEPSKFENVKKLNILKKNDEVSILLNNVKDVKRKLDTILAIAKERGRNEDQKLKDEQRKNIGNAVVKPPLPQPPKEDVVTPIVEVKPLEQPVPVITEVPKAPKPVVIKEPIPSVATLPPTKEVVAPVAASPIKKTIETNIRTKQFGATPSYVRGVMAPPPPRPVSAPPVRQSTFQPRPPSSSGAVMGGGPLRAPTSSGTRPPYNPALRKPTLPKADASATVLLTKDRKVFDKKKEYVKPGDDKKAMTKRTLIRKGFIQEDGDDERMGTRKLKNRKIKEVLVFAPIKIEKAVITTENLTVKILSEKIGKTATEIIKQLMVLGIMTTINSVVDFSTMELVANELGVKLELKIEQTKEEQLKVVHEEEDTEAELVKRSPVITVMGHVDHGKTSLLDAIRKTSVAAGEAGGITQHIGAYSVVCRNEKITFLDTPGHEAFTAMRARGAKVTDISILVVAADDGVMPQTIEAIKQSQAANVPIIVAINKIDKPGANIEKIKQALTEFGLVTEEWGGDTMMVPISAKTGVGIEKLLETILFLAEYNNYRANPTRSARGSIIEAKLDKGKGPVANIIVQNGTLRVGDYVVSGMTCGRVRAMVDDKGRNVKEAGPSTPVSILGFTDVPNAGDDAYVVNDEKIAKQIIDERNTKFKNEQATQGAKVTLDDVFHKISENQIKELNIIIKADVQGSVEALRTSLIKLANDEVKISIVSGGVGAINKSDLMIAGASKAIIIGFNVRPDNETRILADSTGIDIRLYRIIYEAIDDITLVMKGMMAPKFREVILGRAQVRNVFKVTGTGIVAGSYVTGGKVQRGCKVRVFRDGTLVHEGAIANLKRFKDDAKEVAMGYECGINLADFDTIKENDEIEAYTLEQINN